VPNIGHNTSDVDLGALQEGHQDADAKAHHNDCVEPFPSSRGRPDLIDIGVGSHRLVADGTNVQIRTMGSNSAGNQAASVARCMTFL
jgi:hypothetical protein